MRLIPPPVAVVAPGPIATLQPGNIVIIKMIITISTTLIQHAGTMGPSDE